MIEKRLEGWDMELEASGADIASIALALRKPLRPLWISQKLGSQKRTTSEFSWNYIAGAGDDEESWARGLSPDLFWKHVNDIIRSGPDTSCNQKIANIVEKDRVCRAHRGEHAPQLSVRASKCPGSANEFPIEESLQLDSGTIPEDDKSSYHHRITNIAVCKSLLAMEAPPTCCILNCNRESFSVSLHNPGMYLHLPILDSKLDRFSLLRNLPSALTFAQSQLRQGNTLLICCCNGEDISVCVCLAVFTSFFDEAGNFDDGRSFAKRELTKLELRRRLKLLRVDILGYCVLPTEFGRYSKLQTFEVSENHFECEVPRDLCANKVLRGVVVFDNKLTAGLPDSLGDCNGLEIVRVHDKKFSGRIPDGIWTLENLTELMKLHKAKAGFRLNLEAHSIPEAKFHRSNHIVELKRQRIKLEVESIPETLKLLVYEYMENRSLDRWLHSTNRSCNISGSVHHVAVGAAQGLTYLHHHCSTLIRVKAAGLFEHERCSTK
ncbi:hypothetical protein SASPL_157361 [Salvia splendens]|uniref:tRNA A64-2'-O-ribosylphosphate transferase n=1 Tax=Salvia splendens TaxID=180675 RepID=A0A8X8YV60_SALSN|nr:hypothetical protein SASPL_157361 [Salvia splendens]